MSYFNRDQQDYMDSLAGMAPEDKCWCGWYELGECPHCPPGFTCADKKAAWCPECHSDPPPGGGVITHRFNCSRSTPTSSRKEPGDGE